MADWHVLSRGGFPDESLGGETGGLGLERGQGTAQIAPGTAPSAALWAIPRGLPGPAVLTFCQPAPALPDLPPGDKMVVGSAANGSMRNRDFATVVADCQSPNGRDVTRVTDSTRSFVLNPPQYNLASPKSSSTIGTQHPPRRMTRIFGKRISIRQRKPSVLHESQVHMKETTPKRGPLKRR